MELSIDAFNRVRPEHVDDEWVWGLHEKIDGKVISEMLTTMITFKDWKMNEIESARLQQHVIKELNKKLSQGKKYDKANMIENLVDEVEKKVNDGLNAWIMNEIDNNSRKWNRKVNDSKKWSLVKDIVWHMYNLIEDQIEDEHAAVTMTDIEMTKTAELFRVE